jgi:organic radical activating enzyme
VSLTGGEPLLHAGFIASFFPAAPLYLESNMTLPDQARRIQDRVRYVAGDIKLAPCAGDEFESHMRDTVECFRILRNTDSRETFCKIVITADTSADDLMRAVEAVSGYVNCVILQPATQERFAPDPAFLLECQAQLLDLAETRIIPQTHKMWGCL